MLKVIWFIVVLVFAFLCYQLIMRKVKIELKKLLGKTLDEPQIKRMKKQFFIGSTLMLFVILLLSFLSYQLLSKAFHLF